MPSLKGVLETIVSETNQTLTAHGKHYRIKDIELHFDHSSVTGQSLLLGKIIVKLSPADVANDRER